MTVEPGRQTLVVGRARQQIPGQLPRDELIERHVAVERVDDPVAPRPHVAHPVVLIPVGVGVARQVEPLDRHPLAVGRRGQQPIDDALVRPRGPIGEEGIDLGDRGRQAREVERDASNQRRAIRLGRRRHPARLERGQHEPIDLVVRPRVAADARHRHRRRRDERPVRLPLGALLDPAREDAALHVGQAQMRLGRRHHHLRVAAVDASHQLAAIRVAGHHRPASRFEPGQRRLADVQPQPRLTRLVVGTVALEAAIRQQGADVEVEVHHVGHAGHGTLGRAGTAGDRNGQRGGKQEAQGHRRGRRNPEL